MNAINPQQNRADARRILRFVRSMKRLRQFWGDRGTGFNILVKVSPAGPEIVQGPQWADVENLLARFRPVYLDSEDSSFRSVIRILPRHLNLKPADPTSDFKSFSDLEKRWDALLDATTAPVPAGTRVIDYPGIPTGCLGESQEEGLFEIGFDGKVLTGRDAIEMLLYGTLLHADQAKERKRVRMENTFLEPAYRIAIMSLLAELIKTADQLRIYSELFVDAFEKELGQAKLNEIESEFDPPNPNAESRDAGHFSLKAAGRMIAVVEIATPAEEEETGSSTPSARATPEVKT